MLRRLLGPALLLLGLAARGADTAAPPANLDAYVERVRTEFEVPGLAVAIVKDDAVVLEKGYGVRELGRPAAVDAHTLFQIASNTKAFTSAAIAMLVHEGKLRWDGRVIDYLPWFQLSDPYVTREMTVRDLLTHRSGLSLGAGDLLYWPDTDFSTEQIVQRLRYVPLTTSFRSAYAYDNVLYAVAGLTLQQVSGRTWQQFMHERIFAPVGMTETRASQLEIKPGDNVAIGHAKYNFTELRTVPPTAWDNNPAAGAILSNAHDMAKWLRVQLAGGRLPGPNGSTATLFPEAQQQQMWTFVTPVPIPAASVPALAPARPNFLGYGLGWFISDYRGHRIITHTGGWPGQVSRVTLVPDLKLGVVVLTNQESGAAFQSIAWQVLDAYLGAPPTDWIAAYAQAARQRHREADASWAKHVAARDAKSPASLPLAGYAGTYRDPWRGDVTIALENERLVLRFSHTTHLVGDLEHWQHDSFIVHWRERGLNADAFVWFTLTPDGQIEQAKMEPVSPETDFSFDFQDLRLSPVVAAPAAAAP